MIMYCCGNLQEGTFPKIFSINAESGDNDNLLFRGDIPDHPPSLLFLLIMFILLLNTLLGESETIIKCGFNFYFYQDNTLQNTFVFWRLSQTQTRDTTKTFQVMRKNKSSKKYNLSKQQQTLGDWRRLSHHDLQGDGWITHFTHITLRQSKQNPYQDSSRDTEIPLCLTTSHDNPPLWSFSQTVIIPCRSLQDG